MALGILGAMGIVQDTEHHLFAGELSLDGGIRPVRGALSIAACARKQGIRNLIVPADNAAEQPSRRESMSTRFTAWPRQSSILQIPAIPSCKAQRSGAERVKR